MACVEIARGTDTTSSTGTVTATYSGSTLSTGHIVVAAGVNDDTQAAATCDDDAGATNSYSRDDNTNASVSNGVVVFSAAVVDAIDNGTVFTVDFGTNASRKWMIVYHVDDLDDTGGRVVENGRGTGTSQTPTATADASVGVANTLTFAAATVNSDGALAWTPDGIDGDAIDLSNRAGATSFRYRTATGTHTEGGSFTDTAALWSCVMVAYRQTAGGTSETPTPGGATAGGTGPSARTDLAASGAAGGGNPPGSSSTVAAGGALADGVSPSARAAVAAGGGVAAGNEAAARVDVSPGGAIAGGNAPAESSGTSETPTPGGATAGGTGPTATVTVTAGGADAAGSSPTVTTPVGPGGAAGEGAGPTVRVTLTAGGAIAGGNAPDDGLAPAVATVRGIVHIRDFKRFRLLISDTDTFTVGVADSGRFDARVSDELGG